MRRENSGIWVAFWAVLVMAAGLAFCPKETRANAGVYRESASGAVYPINQTDVQLFSERVVVEPLAKTSYSKLAFSHFGPVISVFDCRFVLYNTAKETRSFLMGFPLEYNYMAPGEVLDFTVTVNGKPLTARLKRNTQSITQKDRRTVYTWPMRIEAGQKTVVRVRYGQGWSFLKVDMLDHKFARWLDYLVGPSRRWRGSIGRAEFVVRGFTALVRSLGGHAGKLTQLRVGFVRQPPARKDVVAWKRPMHSVARFDPAHGEARWVFTNWEPRANERLAMMVRSERKTQVVDRHNLGKEGRKDCERMVHRPSAEMPKAWFDPDRSPEQSYRLDRQSVGDPLAQLKECAKLPANKNACYGALETVRQAILVRHGHVPQRLCWLSFYHVSGPMPIMPTTWKPMNTVEEDNLRRIQAARARIDKPPDAGARLPTASSQKRVDASGIRPKPGRRRVGQKTKASPATKASRGGGCGCAQSAFSAGKAGGAEGIGWLLPIVIWVIGRRRFLDR